MTRKSGPERRPCSSTPLTPGAGTQGHRFTGTQTHRVTGTREKQQRAELQVGPSCRGEHSAGRDGWERVCMCARVRVHRPRPCPGMCASHAPCTAWANVMWLLSAPFHARSAAELDNRFVTLGCNFPVWEAPGHNSEQLAQARRVCARVPGPIPSCRPRGVRAVGSQQGEGAQTRGGRRRPSFPESAGALHGTSHHLCVGVMFWSHTQTRATP